MSDLLQRAASRRPNAIALRDDRGEELTYAELSRRVIRGRAHIERAGVGAGERIVLHVPRTCESVVAIHAAIAAGCVVVPISGIGGGTPYETLASCAPAAVVGPGAPRILENIEAPHAISARSIDALPEGASRSTLERPPAQVAATAYIVFTSGSTGTPRGIVGAHSAALFCVEEINHSLGNREDDVILCGLPLSFDYGFYQVFLAAAAMYTLRLTDTFDNPLGLPGLVQRESVTALPATPGLIRVMNKSRLWNRMGDHRLRYVCSTGDYLTQSNISSLSVSLPDTSVVPMYGLSECKRVAISPLGCGMRVEGGVGYPLRGTETKLDGCFELDGRTVGELHVTGPNLMLGYWHANGVTDGGRFYEDAEGKRWLRTGDIFEMADDGYLVFVDRMDAILKVGDAKYSLFETERDLTVVEGVSSIVLAYLGANGMSADGVPDKIVAFVVEDRSRGLEARKIARDVRAFAVERGMGLVPDEICFVDRIPLSDNGKIDRRRLSAEYASMLERHAPAAGLAYRSARIERR